MAGKIERWMEWYFTTKMNKRQQCAVKSVSFWPIGQNDTP